MGESIQIITKSLLSKRKNLSRSSIWFFKILFVNLPPAEIEKVLYFQFRNTITAYLNRECSKPFTHGLPAELQEFLWVLAILSQNKTPFPIFTPLQMKMLINFMVQNPTDQ